MNYQEMITEKAMLLKALAHPIRLCLVKKLCEQGNCNVTYFTNCMEASQSSISQHLGKLRDLGILGFEKDGQNVHYFIKNESVRGIVRSLFGED
ncbi:MAG: metalloregulator ArsR/SmtB family transcription factor [Lachnospiraceae bacterium]|nr:metalloregulator ArsR/SmtB family transcription factor [Lachnospiraceae bacterium]MDY5742329.1 metalloregulator ArsR/SmtB family transcription factor [Lachnospiraceae bacterium]